jgi:hypothetical protein
MFTGGNWFAEPNRNNQIVTHLTQDQEAMRLESELEDAVMHEATDIADTPAPHDTPVAQVNTPDGTHSEDASSHDVEDMTESLGTTFVLMSEGFFQVAVLMPARAHPQLTESEVASIGTTWTYGNLDETPSFAITSQKDECDAVCEGCAICMQPFEEGDRVTALPCANLGCRSVWHLGCMHQWLNKGRTPSCPLCRARISTPMRDVSPPAPTLTIFGSPAGRIQSRFSRDLMGVLLQAMVSHGASGDSSSVSSSPRSMALPSPIEADDENIIAQQAASV